MEEKELLNDDIARNQILPLLKRQQYLENSHSDYSCEALNSMDINTDKIKLFKVKENDEIILASDGYPVLKNTLEESEKLLKKILNEEPLCYKIYKSTKGINKDNKSFDDRTYVKFKI